MGIFRNRRHRTLEVPATPAYIKELPCSPTTGTVSVHPAAASPARSCHQQDATLLSSEAPSPDPHDLTAPPRASRPRRTRVSAAWLGVCFAAIALVVLIVFMLQNTRSVEISFLWLHGNVPLALALLTAGVG
jgi:uncharacterized integral membrane protein